MTTPDVSYIDTCLARPKFLETNLDKKSPGSGLNAFTLNGGCIIEE